MLCDHIVNFLTINLLTKLLHCKANVLLCDLSRRISIELVEDSLQSWLGQEILHVNSGCQELTIVDLFVVVVIHLIDHFRDFSIAYIHTFLHENVVKFLRLDHSSAICINGLELSPQFFHLLLRGSLNEKIHGGLLESWNAFEASESLHDLIANLLVTALLRCWCYRVIRIKFEPLVIQCLLPIHSLFLVEHEELAN